MNPNEYLRRTHLINWYGIFSIHSTYLQRVSHWTLAFHPELGPRLLELLGLSFAGLAHSGRPSAPLGHLAWIRLQGPNPRMDITTRLAQLDWKKIVRSKENLVL